MRAGWDLTLLRQEGLRLNLGNDLFNGHRRVVRFEGGEAALYAFQPAPPALERNGSPWLAVDDLLGVQFLDGAAEPWTLRTFRERNATDMSAHYAILCRPLRSEIRSVAAGGIAQQTCVRLVARAAGTGWTAPATCAWSDGREPALRLEPAGLDGGRYRIAADWAARTVEVARD